MARMANAAVHYALTSSHSDKGLMALHAGRRHLGWGAFQKRNGMFILFPVLNAEPATGAGRTSEMRGPGGGGFMLRKNKLGEGY